MKQGRLHFDEGGIHLVLDSLTGELVELIRKDTGDNLLKNHMYAFRQPFTLTLQKNDGKTYELSPPPHSVAFENPMLKPEITSKRLNDGLCIVVTYQALWNGKTMIPLSLFYSITLTSDTIVWNLHCENSTDDTVDETRFPILNGIWLGESWEDDTLVYPQFSGVKCKNPIECFTQPVSVIDWRWQEYHYQYALNGVGTSGNLKPPGLSGLTGVYPGDLSMSWMDYYDHDGGLYFGCHDPMAHACRLEVGVIGRNSPGVCFSCSSNVRAAAGETFETAPVVTAFHRGDWHDGAKIYRAFRMPTLPPMRRQPEWVKCSPGLHAHYDFKYQSGEVVHCYQDIPRLAREALDVGLNHMLLSGWHKDGFDRGFPCYQYDPDLGTEEDFAAGVAKAQEMGVHVSLYMNIRLHNNDYDQEHIHEKAAINADGNVIKENYGSLSFSAMCPGSQLWQAQMADAVEYAADTYGIDGIYFDQLGSAMWLCYNKAHSHGDRTDAWYVGYRELLLKISSDFEKKHGRRLALMGEWVNDQNGSIVDFQLNQLFYKYHTGGFPEMYAYTFPEHGIIDMLYPEKNLAMRPVHVAQKCRALMARLFTYGSRFWIYDMVDDNTFTRDPENLALLKDLIAMKRIWLDRFGSGRFVDDTELFFEHDNDEFLVKRFETNDGQCFLACFAAKIEENRTVTLNIPFKEANVLLPDKSEMPLRSEGGRLTLPAVNICLITIET